MNTNKNKTYASDMPMGLDTVSDMNHAKNEIAFDYFYSLSGIVFGSSYHMM